MKIWPNWMKEIKEIAMKRKSIHISAVCLLLICSLTALFCTACAFQDHEYFVGKWHVTSSDKDIIFEFDNDNLITDAGVMKYKLSDPNKIEFSTDSGSTGSGTYELSEDKETLILKQSGTGGKIESTTLKKLPEESTETQTEEQN